MKRVDRSLLLAIICTLATSPLLPAGTVKNVRETKAVVVRGHVVCLDSTSQASNSEKDCAKLPHLFGMRASDGQLFRFSPTDSATAMFEDSRVRAQQLQINALLYPENQLEIIKVHAVKAGKLYDVYYYCDVCSITAYAPGPCPCCRREMELREEPVH
ncbi:MAG TPA: hypothetical protein VGL91_01220 [Acidobacteriota bacterium]|jgi:hypothetical protein